MFNKAWKCTLRITIVRCWVSSKILSDQHIETANNLIGEFSLSRNGSINLVQNENNHTVVVDNQSVRSIRDPLIEHQYSANASPPITELVDEVHGINDVIQLMSVLNSLALHDAIESRSDPREDLILHLCGSHRTKNEDAVHESDYTIDLRVGLYPHMMMKL